VSAANRKRGQRAEVAVVNYLRAQGWPDARRYLSGDGRQPGDIDWHPLICLEVKDVAASAWPTWCRQAFAEAPAGTVPVVVRRERGQTDVGQWECRYWWGAWRALDRPAIQGSYRHSVSHHMQSGTAYLSWYAVPLASFVAAVADLDLVAS
jgi:hypothetical protein